MSTRSKQPTKRGVEPSSSSSRMAKATDDDAPFDEKPTTLLESGKFPPRASGAASASPVPAPPIVAKPPAAAPAFRTISMKTPANPQAAPVEKPERERPHVKLRAMSEVAKQTLPQNLGNLAPPYDPAEARKRTIQDYVMWGSIAIMIASVIALGVWFLAS